MFDKDLRQDLRTLVLRFRAGEQRRGFAPVIHVGDLTGAAVSWSLEGRRGIDVALRTDVVAALLDSAADSGVDAISSGRLAVWLTRTGVLSPHDEDLAWSGPAHRAFEAAGMTPRCMVVVTKTGWYAPTSGERSVWKRPRHRHRPADPS